MKYMKYMKYMKENQPNNVQLFPPDNGLVTGSVELPTSKSISNRLLILQNLTDNAFDIEQLSDADDTQILKILLDDINKKTVFDCGHGGTTLRFLTALLAVKTTERVIVVGSKRLHNRPIGILVDSLRELGADIDYLEKEGFPPLVIKPALLNKTNSISIDGSVSSQFISAVLLVAPLLPDGLSVEMDVIGLVSMPYISLTIAALQNLKLIGIKNEETEMVIKNRIKLHVLPLKNKKKPFKTQVVPRDWSSATYFLTLAAFGNPESSIFLADLHLDSMQADEHILHVLNTKIHKNTELTHEEIPLVQAMTIDNGESLLTCSDSRKGITIEQNKSDIISLKQAFSCLVCPDAVQTIAVFYAMKRKKVRITDLQTLRIKETDRIEALQTELAKIGVLCETTDDTFSIVGFDDTIKLKNIVIQTYNDHRMAMAFAALSLQYPGITIENAEVVTKSFPDFWKQLEQLGFKTIFTPQTP